MLQSIDMQTSEKIVRAAAFQYVMSPDIEACYATFFDSLIANSSGHEILPHFMVCQCVNQPDHAFARFIDILQSTIMLELPVPIIGQVMRALDYLVDKNQAYHEINEAYERYQTFQYHLFDEHKKNELCAIFNCDEECPGTAWQRSCEYITGVICPCSSHLDCADNTEYQDELVEMLEQSYEQPILE